VNKTGNSSGIEKMGWSDAV